MQHKLEKNHNLVDKNGHILEAGWSTEFVLNYNKSDIRRKSEVLEWEYYLALTREYALGVSIAGNYDGTGRRLSIHFMNFVENWFACDTEWMLSEGEIDFSMPTTVNQSVHFSGKRSEGRYRREDESVTIEIHNENILPGKAISASLRLDIPKGDNMMLLVPYSDPEMFYYNYKINCMPTEGEVVMDGKKYTFTRENAMGTYDWGRGIWKPVNQWYWGSVSTVLNGKPFGFNIGHGFGDTSKATENMIFYDGVCHKLDQIQFHIPGDEIGNLRLTLPQENYMRPWKFKTNDGRLDMDFLPVMDRTSGLNPGEYYDGQHQVFGNYSGAAVLDDGTCLEFRNLFGFAEKVGNVWKKEE